MPHLHVSLNGGLVNIENELHHLETLDGLMLGREAYHNPWILTEVDPLFGATAAPVKTRREAVEAMLPYIEKHLSEGLHLHRITRHMLGLYHAQPGGRMWRQVLSTQGCKVGAGVAVVMQALGVVEAQAARQAA